MSASPTIWTIDLPLSSLAVLKTWLQDCQVSWKSLAATDLPANLGPEISIPDVVVWYLTAENAAVLFEMLQRQLALVRTADQIWILTEQELPAAAGPYFSSVGIAQVWRSSLELGPRLQLAIKQLAAVN